MKLSFSNECRDIVVKERDWSGIELCIVLINPTITHYIWVFPVSEIWAYIIACVIAGPREELGGSEDTSAATARDRGWVYWVTGVPAGRKINFSRCT